VKKDNLLFFLFAMFIIAATVFAIFSMSWTTYRALVCS
jgi:hypothetical protein